MLAVFDKSVAKSPEALQSPESGSVSALKDGFLAQHFASVHPSSVTVNLGSSGLFAYSNDKQNPLLPRYPLRNRTKIMTTHVFVFDRFCNFG
jgi:hypothetical protein